MIVQVAPTATLTFDALTLVAPAAKTPPPESVTESPPQLPLSLTVPLASVRPVGSASVKPSGVRVGWLSLAGFAIVNVSWLVPPAAIVEGLNAFVSGAVGYDSEYSQPSVKPVASVLPVVLLSSVTDPIAPDYH